MSDDFFGTQLGYFKTFWPYVQLTWWVWLPPVLFYAAWWMWKRYLEIRYFTNLQWSLLEVRIPREIVKPPQAMEQIFAGLHSAYRKFDFEEKYWQGLQTDYFSFEIVSVGGKVHFYIYAPKVYRNLVEALIYAQYPESEVKEVKDYTAELPEDIPNDEWNLYGSEFALVKPDPYPIRTYKDFMIEEVSSREELTKVDPLSAMAEVLAKIKPHEFVGVQLLIRPTGDDWKKEGEELVAKIIGKEKPAAPGMLEKFLGGMGEMITEVVEGTATLPKKDEKQKTRETLMQHLSPGEKDIITAIGRNISKIGFQTILRFLYVGRSNEFDMMNFAAIQGVLRQFNTQNLNSFKIQSKGLTTAKWYNPWKLRVKLKRKRVFYRYYKRRAPFMDLRLLRSKPFIFNIEELATIYHYPGETVSALTTQRIEAKRGEPPRDLPI